MSEENADLEIASLESSILTLLYSHSSYAHISTPHNFQKQLTDPKFARQVLGYMRYNGESIGQVCNAARGAGTKIDIIGVDPLPYIC
jgi:hypothetical protein